MSVHIFIDKISQVLNISLALIVSFIIILVLSNVILYIMYNNYIDPTARFYSRSVRDTCTYGSTERRSERVQPVPDAAEEPLCARLARLRGRVYRLPYSVLCIPTREQEVHLWGVRSRLHHGRIDR